MPRYDEKKLAREGLLNVAQHCALAALDAPRLTGKTEIRVEALDGEDLLNGFQVTAALNKLGGRTTGIENWALADAKGQPIVVVLVGADVMPLVKAPCRRACPAGIDAPRYIRLIGDGEYCQAAQVNREKTPFPAVLGRVCRAPCETKCWRGEVRDSPIAIRALKRFATDQAGEMTYVTSPSAPNTGKKVGVIGSGPAGLTAAYYLRKVCGHFVTVFEAMPEPGGMMRAGIPEYRLPKKILQREIEAIQAVGVDIKTGTRVESIQQIKDQGYDAVFVALGAHKCSRLGIVGDAGPGVIDGASLLRKVNLGQSFSPGNKVAVIGGGNVAVDAARTALRLGAKEVTILYRRSPEYMPADKIEVEQAVNEGVKLECLAAPSKMSHGKDSVKIECIRMRLGAPDETGRPRPLPVAGSEFTIQVNTVVVAVGEMPDIPTGLGLKSNVRGTLEADPHTLATSMEGVYAGGDAVTGPASVIEAVAAGRKAASSIDQYLGGIGRIEEVVALAERVPETRKAQGTEGSRPEPEKLSVEKRLGGFEEVEKPLTEEQAVAEDLRCLRCDTVGYDCGACGHPTCREAVIYTNNKINATGGEPWGWIWKGPSCIWRTMELGIAAEWIAAACHNNNVETRVQMVPGGTFMRMGYMEGCSSVLAFPIGPALPHWHFDPGTGKVPPVSYEKSRTGTMLRFPTLWTRFFGPGRDTGRVGMKTRDNWWDAPYSKLDIVEDNDWWKFMWDRDIAYFAAADEIRRKLGVKRLNLPALRKLADEKKNQVPPGK